MPVHGQAVKKGVDLTVAAAANTEISFGVVCYANEINANEINANQINHTAPVITDKPTPAWKKLRITLEPSSSLTNCALSTQTQIKKTVATE